MFIAYLHDVSPIFHMTPLHIACEKNAIDVVKVLVEKKADYKSKHKHV